MSIALLTKATGTITAKDDGMLYRAIVSAQNRIISGCTLSIVNTNKIKITAGYVLVCGRLCKVEEESMTVSLASSGTQKKYLFIELSPESNPNVKFNSGSSYAVGDDINNNESGTYKALLCIYTATTSAVSTIAPQMFTVDPRVTLFTGGSSQISGTAGNIIVPAASLANFRTIIITALSNVFNIPAETWLEGETIRIHPMEIENGSSTSISWQEFELKRNNGNIEIVSCGSLYWNGTTALNAVKSETSTSLFINTIHGDIL